MRVEWRILLLPLALAVLRPAATMAQAWQDLSPRQRYDAMRNYRQYESAPAEKQQAIDEGFERWRNLPPQEQEKVRRNYERFQQLTPAQRAQLERKYEKWKDRPNR